MAYIAASADPGYSNAANQDNQNTERVITNMLTDMGDCMKENKWYDTVSSDCQDCFYCKYGDCYVQCKGYFDQQKSSTRIFILSANYQPFKPNWTQSNQFSTILSDTTSDQPLTSAMMVQIPILVYLPAIEPFPTQQLNHWLDSKSINHHSSLRLQLCFGGKIALKKPIAASSCPYSSHFYNTYK